MTMKNKILWATTIGSAVLFATAGIALADEGQQGPPPPPPQGGVGIFQHLQTDIGAMFGDNHGDVDVNASTSANVNDEQGEHGGNATSTPPGPGMPGMHGEKNGLLKHFGTTTPPGIGRHEGTSTDEGNATSSGKGEGIGKGGIAGFFQWLFGLPASTTIGDIRTQIEASTTASTTSPGNPQGLGFWAHIFDFFHFGK